MMNAVFAVQPKLLDIPSETFGERTKMEEIMGRLGLAFECFVEEGGRVVSVVAEFRGVEVSEGEEFVQRFGELVGKLVGGNLEELIEDFDV